VVLVAAYKQWVASFRVNDNPLSFCTELCQAIEPFIEFGDMTSKFGTKATVYLN
jgi:hypothetical protein